MTIKIWCSYDLRFPEVYQALTFSHGAQILLMPSAFTKLTGRPDKDGLYLLTRGWSAILVAYNPSIIE